MRRRSLRQALVWRWMAFATLLSLLFVAKFIPETNGRSLEDM